MTRTGIAGNFILSYTFVHADAPIATVFQRRKTTDSEIPKE
jgi:hypothetical protein